MRTRRTYRIDDNVIFFGMSQIYLSDVIQRGMGKTGAHLETDELDNSFTLYFHQNFSVELFYKWEKPRVWDELENYGFLDGLAAERREIGAQLSSLGKQVTCCTHTASARRKYKDLQLQSTRIPLPRLYGCRREEPSQRDREMAVKLHCSLILGTARCSAVYWLNLYSFWATVILKCKSRSTLLVLHKGIRQKQRCYWRNGFRCKEWGDIPTNLLVVV